MTYTSKRVSQSGTFWSALTGGVISTGYAGAGAITGNWHDVINGLLSLLAFWTAWRLRKGQGVPII